MKKVKHGGVFTAIFSIISIGYIFPIMLFLLTPLRRRHTLAESLLTFLMEKCM